MIETMATDRDQQQEENGLRCRSCGCRHLPVLETRKRPGGRIVRRRICRHCGRRMLTYEREAGTPE